MPEYIERTEIERFIAEHGMVGPFSVDLLPSADVAPVRHGRWAYCGTYIDGITMFTCSCCGDKQNGRNGWSWKKNFCPNCGAKMDGKPT